MIIRKILMLVLLCLSLAAAAQMVTVVRAYEISISDLRLPRFSSGTISFKDCVACDLQVIRVTDATRYVLNGKNMPLDEFKVAIKSIHNKDTNISTVMHHLESDTVTEVMVVRK